MKINKTIIFIMCLILVGGGAFFLGRNSMPSSDESISEIETTDPMNQVEYKELEFVHYADSVITIKDSVFAYPSYFDFEIPLFEISKDMVLGSAEISVDQEWLKVHIDGMNVYIDPTDVEIYELDIQNPEVDIPENSTDTETITGENTEIVDSNTVESEYSADYNIGLDGGDWSNDKVSSGIPGLEDLEVGPNDIVESMEDAEHSTGEGTGQGITWQ